MGRGGGFRLYKELGAEIKHCTLKNKMGWEAAELRDGGAEPKAQILCRICLCTESPPPPPPFMH